MRSGPQSLPALLAAPPNVLSNLTPDEVGDALDNSPAVIYVKDAAGHYLFVNRQYERLTGHSRREVLGATDYDVFPKEHADEYRANDQRVLREKRVLVFTERAQVANGIRTYTELKIPLLGHDGEPYAVCGIATEQVT
jgi:PAS domain S-box-containing protein